MEDPGTSRIEVRARTGGRRRTADPSTTASEDVLV
jgi:hypothetical protein